MLKLSIVEFMIRAVPEMFVLVLAAYMFSKEKIEIKKYIITSIALCIGVVFIRLLPITYGVHTMLNIILMTILVVMINKIDIIKAIRSSVIITMILFMCEGANIFILSNIFNVNLEIVAAEPKLKTIYGYPSLVLFSVCIVLYYNFIYKKKVLKYV